MYQQPSERAQEALGGTPGHFLNTVFVGVVAAGAAGFCVWLLAFGGVQTIENKADRVQFSSSAPWLSIKSAHQDVAESAVLTLGDLPPGWVIAEDDSDDEADHELSEECESIDEQASSEGVAASATSDSMEGPESQRLTSDAAVFSNAESAQRSLDRFRDFFSRCSADFVAQFEEGVRKGAAEDGIQADQLQIQATMSEVGPPAVGESGLTFRMSGTVTGPNGSFEFAVDLIAFRIGRMDAALIYTTIGGLRPEEEQQITQIAAGKLQAANATLPQG